MSEANESAKPTQKTLRLELQPGKKATVRVEPHARYEVVEASTGQKPLQLKARRVGDDLELTTDETPQPGTEAAATQPQAVLEGYYSQTDVQLVGGTGEAAFSYGLGEEVSTTAFTTVAEAQTSGAALAVLPVLSPFTMALAGGAGLAVAAGGGGGGTPNKLPVATFTQAQEAKQTDAPLKGQLTATDEDKGAVLTYSLEGSAIKGLTIAADGSWTFDPSAYKSLAANETQTIKVTYKVTDERGGSDTESFTINVTGTNDAAQITGSSRGAVTEDAQANTAGTLNVSDVDAGESAFQTPSNLKGEYGTFTFDENSGDWTYQLDNQAVQTLREGYFETDTLSVKSKDGSASQDIVVNILGVDDQAQIELVADAKGTDLAQVNVTESVDHTMPSAQGTVTVGTLDYGDRIIVKGVKFNAADSSSLVGTGLTGADIENGFLNSLTLNSIEDNGGVHNLSWAFYTNGNLPKDFKLVLDYTLASINSNGDFDSNGFPVGDTVDEQVFTITTTGVNSAVTVSKQGADADALTVDETNGVVASAVQSLTVNEWDYGDLINVGVSGAKIDLQKTNFLSGNENGFSYFENYIKGWLEIKELGDLASSSNLKWQFKTNYSGDLDFVPGNDELVIDYTLAIFENGQRAATTKNIEISVVGTNDAPTYDMYGTDTAEAQLNLTSMNPAKASGTLSPYDVDFGDTISHKVMGLTFDAIHSSGVTQAQFDQLKLEDLLTIQTDPDFGNEHSLTWFFNQSEAAIAPLPPGAHLAMDYTLRVTDLLGASSDQKIHIDLYA